MEQKRTRYESFIIATQTVIILVLLALGVRQGSTPTKAQALLTLTQIDTPLPTITPGGFGILNFNLMNNSTTSTRFTINVTNISNGQFTIADPGPIAVAANSSAAFSLTVSTSRFIDPGTSYTVTVSAVQQGDASLRVSAFGQFRTTGDPPTPTSAVGVPSACQALPLVIK